MSNIHPDQPRRLRLVDESVVRPSATESITTDLAGVDPGPHIGSKHRFDSFDSADRTLHHIITPPVLAGVANTDLATGEAVHCALFCLLESVGDFEGLIAAPPIFIGPDLELLHTAEAWTAERPGPAVEAMWGARTPGDDHRAIAQQIDAALAQHSLGLADAAGTNPSLTYGSYEAMASTLLDGVDLIHPSHHEDEVVALVDIALFLFARVAAAMPDIAAVGGARIHLGRGWPMPTFFAGRSN